jgi:hypothetical protein
LLFGREGLAVLHFGNDRHGRSAALQTLLVAASLLAGPLCLIAY